jgi:outer membrane receptor protein involved in Fe transport
MLAGHNFLDGRANVTISGEYNRGKGFLWNDRRVLAEHRFYDVCPPGSQYTQCLYSNLRQPLFGGESGTPLVSDVFPLTPDFMTQYVGAPGYSFGVQDANGNDVMFAPNGGFIPIDYGKTPGGFDNAPSTFNVIGGNGFDIYNTLQALSDTKRYNANILAHVDLTDNIRLFGEGWYSHSASTQLRNQPIYTCGCFGIPAGQPAGNLILSVDNPFLTTDERSLILNNIENNPLSDRNINCTFAQTAAEAAAFCGANRPDQDYFYLTRANTDLYSARATYTDDLYRVVGGLNGHFGLFGHQWNWEVVGNYGRSHTRGKELQVNEQNFQNAVQAVRDSSGNIVCAPHTNSPFPTLNSTCTPLDLFGHGLSSQAALDYILSPAGGSTVNTQRVFTADVTGPLFKLPGGDFSVALGAETRHETSDFEPSAFYRGGPDPDPTVDSNGDGDPANDFVSFYQGVPIQPVKGSFTTKELFGEANADIVGPSNNIAGIYRLDTQLAVRYVNHSVAGNAITWTAGARYAPVRDLAFRGNFTHAIRAPSIQETTIPTSTFYNGATDPCDINQLAVGPDPATRAKNCATSGPLGVYSGFHQNAGVTFLQGVRGNPNLKNETSNAYSIGGVLSPRFIPHFSLTADYVNVKLENAIANFSATQVLNACYDATDFPNNFYCTLIRRNQIPGTQLDQLSFVNTSFFNANELHYRGIVASLDYWIATPFLGAGSKISINGQYQRLLTLTSRASDQSSNTHNQGTLGYPKNSAVINVNYQNKWLSLYSDFNYTGPVNQEPAGYREFQRLKGVIYTNVGFKIEAAHGLRIFMDVDNVFNRGVPYPVPAFGGSVTYFPGVLGRYYRIGAGYHF